VTLDVFSGKPNPTWELSQEQQTEFMIKISGLEHTEDIQKSSRLGYRGLIVEEKINPKVQRIIELNDGVIRIFEGKLASILKDKDSEIERWLLHTAPKIIDKDLLNSIEEKLKK
jgi:hypothetical protein